MNTVLSLHTSSTSHSFIHLFYHLNNFLQRTCVSASEMPTVYTHRKPQIWSTGQLQRGKNRGRREGMHPCCECRLGAGIRQRSLRCWVKHGSPPATQDPWGDSPLCLTEKWIKAKKQKWQPVFGSNLISQEWVPKPLDWQEEDIKKHSLPLSVAV